MFLTESGVQLLLTGVRVWGGAVLADCAGQLHLTSFPITEISTCNLKIPCKWKS